MNNNLFEVGDSKITYYQKFIIVVGIILLFSFTLLSLNSNKFNYYYFSLIIVVIFLVISYLYSKVYSIKYDSEYFYISNTFKKVTISTSQFIEIRKVRFIDFLYVAIFKDKSFLLMIKSETIIKNFFKFHNKYAEEMTQKIRKTINAKPDQSNQAR